MPTGRAQQATKSAGKPCGELPLDLFMRDALATVELVHPLLDCREKFNPVGDFLQRNFIGQLTNGIQNNFFPASRREYLRPFQARQTGRSAFDILAPSFWYANLLFLRRQL
jgi:hypothetical protein